MTTLAWIEGHDQRLAERLRGSAKRRTRSLAVLLSGANAWAWPAAAALVAAGGHGRAVIAAALGVALAVAALMPLKRRFARPRPCQLAPRAGEPTLTPHFEGDLHSFPSGHATVAFACGTALAPALAGVPLLVAAAVGLSRVALGHHYLSDVVAGALLGAAAGGLGLWLAAAA
jgi:undecaprenyl-diphosphatase